MLPIEPVRPQLVEPAAPAHAVVRRRDERQDEQPRQRHEEPKRDDEEDDPEGGIHIDVLA